MSLFKREFWKRSPHAVVVITLAAILFAGVAVGYKQGRDNRRQLSSAVDKQIDAHAAKIAALLCENTGKTTPQTEDAIYEELQRAPSTSLITRAMVSVKASRENVMECIIALDR